MSQTLRPAMRFFSSSWKYIFHYSRYIKYLHNNFLYYFFVLFFYIFFDCFSSQLPLFFCISMHRRNDVAQKVFLASKKIVFHTSCSKDLLFNFCHHSFYFFFFLWFNVIKKVSTRILISTLYLSLYFVIFFFVFIVLCLSGLFCALTIFLLLGLLVYNFLLYIKVLYLLLCFCLKWVTKFKKWKKNSKKNFEKLTTNL